jgi:23S rRNA pseudouridine1911/1915/1917 synthase
MRLDQFLAGQVGLSRSQLHRLIGLGCALVNGQPARPSQKVRIGDLVKITVPPPRSLSVIPQNIPLTVLYQDAELIVIEKPAGLSVHPGPGHPDGTLVNALLALCPDIKGIGGAIRPGIVQRLDKDTSGLMVVAKTDLAHWNLSEQIKQRTVTKGYMGLVIGNIRPESGLVDAPIARDPRHRKRMAVVLGGRAARTRYKVLERIAGCSLLAMSLETGRTHQLRVHMAYLGHPLFGDAVYGKSSPLLSRQFLHANHLGFLHPTTGKPMEFRLDMPDDLANVINELRMGTPNNI